MYIVVGASRGIGFAVVEGLIGKGEEVVALSRSVSSLEKLKQQNDLLHVHSVDISDDDQISSFIKESGSKIAGKVKGVVYCAGLLRNKPFEDLSRKDWKDIYEVNVFGPVMFCRELLKIESNANGVNTLFIGSMGGYQGAAKFPGLSAYSSSKAAIACASDCLAEEYKDTQHTFNTLSIGAVQTEMLEQAFPGYKAEVSPSEMADFIITLVCRGKSLINGKNIPVSRSTP